MESIITLVEKFFRFDWNMILRLKFHTKETGPEAAGTNWLYLQEEESLEKCRLQPLEALL